MLTFLVKHQLYLSASCYVTFFTTYPHHKIQSFTMNIPSNQEREKIIDIVKFDPCAYRIAQMIYFPMYDYDSQVQSSGATDAENIIIHALMDPGASIIKNLSKFVGYVNLYNVMWKYEMFQYLYIMLQCDYGENIPADLRDKFTARDHVCLNELIKAIKIISSAQKQQSSVQSSVQSVQSSNGATHISRRQRTH